MKLVNDARGKKLSQFKNASFLQVENGTHLHTNLKVRIKDFKGYLKKKKRDLGVN